MSRWRISLILLDNTAELLLKRECDRRLAMRSLNRSYYESVCEALAAGETMEQPTPFDRDDEQPRPLLDVKTELEPQLVSDRELTRIEGDFFPKSPIYNATASSALPMPLFSSACTHTATRSTTTTGSGRPLWRLQQRSARMSSATSCGGVRRTVSVSEDDCIVSEVDCTTRLSDDRERVSFYPCEGEVVVQGGTVLSGTRRPSDAFRAGRPAAPTVRSRSDRSMRP